jgi:transcriptional regulator with XRE-family HTH domain
MLSKTVHDGLSAYAIGERVRALRLKKKMGLVELGLHTGLSPALLSKIERGRLFPTLPTLLRIALVFSVGLDFFFSGAREKPALAIVRREDRLRFPERPGSRDVSYEFESLDFPATERKLNAYYAEFYSSGTRRMHEHAGVEFIYVLNGRLDITVNDQEHVLQTGDSMYFDSGQAHGYRRAGGRKCTALVVTVP